MAYTPVPSVIAGDWIDEVFINTYWVDNMAAGVPDVFTTKGQLAVALGTDSMGVLSVGANNKVLMADSAQTLGMLWGDVAVLFSSVATVTGFSGVSKNTGTYNLSVSDISLTVPSSAKAILVNASAQWSTIASNPLILVERAAGHPGVIIDGTVVNWLLHSQGIVPLNAGAFVVRVLIQNVTLITVNVVGYLL